MTQPTPEEIEAVARAIARADNNIEDYPSIEWLWQHRVTEAQAAITALTALGYTRIPPDHVVAPRGSEVVDFYEREFYPLSNFSSFNLQWDNWTFATSEAAYHFEKFEIGTDVRQQIRLAPSAHEAFKIAERNKQWRHPDWDDIKVGIMAKIIRAKADQHEYVRRKLMETDDRLLIEGSWRDDFWGVGPNGDGQNMLGRLWMAERDRRRALFTAAPPTACQTAPNPTETLNRVRAWAKEHAWCQECGLEGLAEILGDGPVA